MNAALPSYQRNSLALEREGFQLLSCNKTRTGKVELIEVGESLSSKPSVQIRVHRGSSVAGLQGKRQEKR